MEFTIILHVFALIFGLTFTIRVKTKSNAYTFIILYYWSCLDLDCLQSCWIII